jgi:Plant transposon protein
MFANVQEGARKAVERIFAVLFSRWRVRYCPAGGWHIDDLLQILTTCCLLHNMIIEDKQEYGDDNIAGTRNIISFDESAPPSDMVQCLLAQTRVGHAEHWRETADLVEKNELHVFLKKAIPNPIWNKHGSGGGTEYIAFPLH